MSGLPSLQSLSQVQVSCRKAEVGALCVLEAWQLSTGAEAEQQLWPPERRKGSHQAERTGKYPCSQGNMCLCKPQHSHCSELVEDVRCIH